MSRSTRRRILPAVLITALAAALAPGATQAADGPGGEGGGPPLEDSLARLRERYGSALPVMNARDFRHPAERKMVATLMELNPGIQAQVPQVQRDQIAQVREKDRFYMLNSVQVGPRQYPSVWRVAQKAARVLGLDKEFKIFVLNDAEMQTDVFGFVRHDHYGNSFSEFSIRLNSGLVKALSSRELEFVLGREMGHVKANHRFYAGLLWAYQGESGKLPKIYPDDRSEDAAGMGGALRLLFEKAPGPSRISELSADRAGLVVCGDPDVAYSALAKLASGDMEGASPVDLEALLEQARSASAQIDPDKLAEVMAAQGYQPYTMTRLRELSDYAASTEYEVVAGRRGDPFLTGLSIYFDVSEELASGRQRLVEFDADPSSIRLDPLERDTIRAALQKVVALRVEPAAALEELLAAYLIATGLHSENRPYDGLVTFVERKGDARPVGGLLQRLAEKLSYYAGHPDLPEAARALAKARLERVKQLQELAPSEPEEERGRRRWVEPIDLAGALSKPLQRLKNEAREGNKSSFFGTVQELRPLLRDTFLSLVTQMGAEHAAGLVEYAAPVRGEAATAAQELRRAGQDPEKLGALFDEYFDHYAGFLKRIPFFIVKRYVKNLDIPVSAE